MDAIGKKVETYLKSDLPKTFGLIVDGYSCDHEHYFAIFASWTDGTEKVQRRLLCCCVQDELDDEDEANIDLTAESLGDYILDELTSVGHNFDSIEFISGDNTATNPKLARLIGLKIGKVVPLVGCASYRLNLAVMTFIDTHYQGLINKISTLSKALRTLKNSSKLRKRGIKEALLSSTEWGSLFAMVNRYVEIEDKLPDCNLDDKVLLLIPSRAEHSRILQMREELKEFNCVSMLLQQEGDLQLDMSEVRHQFDMLIEKFPVTASHLSVDADIVQNPTFEKAIVKIQNGYEESLTRQERDAVARFRMNAEEADSLDSAVEVENVRNAAAAFESHRASKKLRRQLDTKYRSTKHVYCTTNVVERLFSRAKIITTHLRQGMTTRRLELFLFLRFNKHLWTAKTVQQVIDDGPSDQDENEDDSDEELEHLQY
eukprot:CAMPEP_0185042242 /NCGR_PEP_ID=MMETSP1103-20130426/42236_1 /TAXON_ID=36769 /ORGANISM="Paraphysomonas bandaiensis, Strain Caron Lab Isolate" /LENGTH=429 /DNA_ID=CAMNT_0027582275 /DNA_START=560 /DNA_END=1849 /DNA_ORIENTATION=-